MKILFIAHSGELSGGANRSLLTLMAGLRKQYGVTPSVLIPGIGTPLETHCKAIGIPVYSGAFHSCCTVFRHTPKDLLRVGKLLLAPMLDKLKAKRLNQTLPEDFDLYYTNDRMICVGGYLAHLRGKPHVWHVRSFSRANRTWFPPFWYRLMNRYADRIILVSQALYEDFARHIPSEKLRRVYVGLEPERCLSYERRPHRGFRLLLAARLTPVKGQEDALRALDILVHRYGADAYLSFAGQAPAYEGQTYARRLWAMTARLGLESRVCFLGEVENLSAIRAETNAELMCSRMEPFGRTTVEAMLAGLPVVGADAGGTAEIIVNGKTGLLYPAGNVEALAECLNRLRTNPETAEKMGRAGRERALQCFTAAQTVFGVMEVLHELT